MLALFETNRCRKCHNEKKVRKCARTNKEICWSCCNSLRYDLSCPDSCAYSGKNKTENESPFPSFKADSHTEAKDVTKLYIDRWIDKAQDKLKNLSPLEAAEKEKELLLAWLSSFQYPHYIPLEYLTNKLGVRLSQVDKSADPEEIGALYLEAAIALDWEEMYKLSINKLEPDGAKERQIELLQAITQLKKISTFGVIHGGLTEDLKTALIYYELNHGKEWTLVLSQIGSEWWVRQNISGSPKDFFLQNSTYQAIAELLSKQDDAAAWKLIQESMKKYPDSADLYYYRGIYWLLVKQQDSAKVDFFNSIALDNHFNPSYQHLAILCSQERNWREAIYWFNCLYELDPTDDNKSNLAAAYANSGEMLKAKQLWEEIIASNPNYNLARENLEKLSV